MLQTSIYHFISKKKDQCLTCVKHSEKQKRGTETEEDKCSHQEHINMKNKARDEKTRDKDLAKKKTHRHMLLHLTYRLSFLHLAAWSVSSTTQENYQCTTLPYIRLGMARPVASFGMRHKASGDPVNLPHASSSTSSHCQ